MASPSLMSGSQSWYNAVPRVMLNDTSTVTSPTNLHPPDLGSIHRSSFTSTLSTVHSRMDVFRSVVEQLVARNEVGQLGQPYDIDDEHEYDTDIEIGSKLVPVYDQWGRHVYVSTCNRIGINPLTHITKALRKSSLVIKGQGLRWQDALAMSYALLENVTISVLNLDGNNIGPKGAMYLSCMLSENFNIKNISIADNDIGNEGVQYVIDALKTNHAIIRCNLSGNSVDDVICSEISQLIKTSKTLQILDLSHNHITDIGAEHLGNAIGENDYMKQLNLSWNKIRPAGMVLLFNGVQQNAALKELDVSMNGADLAGAEAAAEMLKKNRTLRELDMTNTRLSDQGLGLISKALSVNDCLQTLKISQNSITASGAAILADCLKNNDSSALSFVDLSTTHVLQDFMDDLEELKKLLPCIRVDVGGIVSTYHCADGSKGNEMSNKNPLTLLRWYVASKSLRLIDLFRQFDKDNSMTVSREEFVEGLQTIKMPLSTSQLERLIDMLDKDGDGEVDYGELVEGDKQHRRKLRKLRGSLQQQQKEAVEKLLAPPSPGSRSPRMSREEKRDSLGDIRRRRSSNAVPARKISTVIAPTMELR